MTSIMEIIFGTTPETSERAIWRVNLRISGCKFFGSRRPPVVLHPVCPVEYAFA